MLTNPYRYLFSGISKSILSANSILFDRAITKKITKIKIITLYSVKSIFFIFHVSIAYHPSISAISPFAIFFDLPINLTFLIESKFDKSLPTIIKPIIPKVL